MHFLTSVFFVVLLMTVSSSHLEQYYVSDQKKIDLVTTFHMKVFNDGLLSDDTLFVSLKIYGDQGKVRAKWIHAYYKLFDETGIGVRIQQFATANDTITDLEVKKDTFQFTLHYDVNSPLKVVGTRIRGSYHVEGIGLWWSEHSEKTVKVTWSSVDQLNIGPSEPKKGILLLKNFYLKN